MLGKYVVLPHIISTYHSYKQITNACIWTQFPQTTVKECQETFIEIQYAIIIIIITQDDVIDIHTYVGHNNSGLQLVHSSSGQG